jgi:hypothetical protein
MKMYQSGNPGLDSLDMWLTVQTVLSS